MNHLSHRFIGQYITRILLSKNSGKQNNIQAFPSGTGKGHFSSTQRPRPGLIKLSPLPQENSEVIDRLQRVGMVGTELCLSPREGFALQLLRLAARDPTGGVGIMQVSRPATDLRKGEKRRTMSSTVLGLSEKGACQAHPVFIAVCKPNISISIP